MLTLREQVLNKLEIRFFDAMSTNWPNSSTTS